MHVGRDGSSTFKSYHCPKQCQEHDIKQCLGRITTLQSAIQ